MGACGKPGSRATSLALRQNWPEAFPAVQYGDRLCEACYRAVWRQCREAREAKRRRLEPPAADAPSTADAQPPAAANDPDAAA